ncbi:MAG: hypothetical protein LBJ18_00780 [Rickettsiales bacterium]|jgi:hypothetical protein|nr:hypothetical protein [Rickettsiales bacterium]
MKKIFFALCLIPFALPANAGYDSDRFLDEIRDGLDVVSANDLAYVDPDPAPGELGRDVYRVKGAAENPDLDLFIPIDMYVRGGVGANLGFASGKANGIEQSGGWTTQIGLGWDMSSYVRTEIDFQNTNFAFSGTNRVGSAREIGGTLYFDFARRWVRRGDITHRRRVVPFMGIGAGAGAFDFKGSGGANGAFVAPRGVLGLNVMLTDLIGIDLSYQYKAFISDGFGWGTMHGWGVNSQSDIMATFRFNF